MNGHTPRPATSADNAGLLALAAACPMQAGLTLCVRREPDFFALNRLQGDRWDVGVVDDRTGVIGCIATAERLAYVNGAPAPTAYVSDLKVHPAFRGRRNETGSVADALTAYARDTLGATDPRMLVLITVLGGNAAMAPRLPGPRGLPRLSRFATIRTFAVPLFVLRRLGAPEGLCVRPAEEGGRAAAPACAGAEGGRLPSSLRRCPGSLSLVLLDRTPHLRAPGRVRRAVGPTPAQEHGRAAVFPAGCAVPLRLQPGRPARRRTTAPCTGRTASLRQCVSGLRAGDRARRAARPPGCRRAGTRELTVRLLHHR